MRSDSAGSMLVNEFGSSMSLLRVTGRCNNTLGQQAFVESWPMPTVDAGRFGSGTHLLHRVQRTRRVSRSRQPAGVLKRRARGKGHVLIANVRSARNRLRQQYVHHHEHLPRRYSEDVH